MMKIVVIFCFQNLTINVKYSRIDKNMKLRRIRLMSDKKKTCFVITPIGDDNSDIRRHIDGIIDQAIIPAVGYKYEISVSHRDFEIGSINDRIVKRVYESDLVIANLTNTNPNVMYELAIRYSSGKPAIVIAEKGTKLPFDVIDENTIFYINDPAGANELKDKICETEKKIDISKNIYGPVLKAINKIPLYNEVESGAVTGEDVPSGKMMQYIIDRLDTIENKVIAGPQKKLEYETFIIEFIVSNDADYTLIDNALNKYKKAFSGTTYKLESRAEDKENIIYKYEIKSLKVNMPSLVLSIEAWANDNGIICDSILI